MKLSFTIGILTLVSAPVIAQDFGGQIALTYGEGSIDETNSGLDTMEGSNHRTRIEGSVGFDLGKYGLQFDLGHEAASAGGEDLFQMNAATAHLMYSAGDRWLVGGFIGTGDGDHIYDGDDGEVTWYGVEGVYNFTNSSLGVQLGVTDHSNSHSALDYSGEILATVEYRHFINDDFLIRGTAGYSEHITHGDPGSTFVTGIEASYGLADDFYVTGGIRNADISNSDEGSYEDLSAYIGFTFAFGSGSGSGGTLRDSYGATPMNRSMVAVFNAVNSSIVD